MDSKCICDHDGYRLVIGTGEVTGHEHLADLADEAVKFPETMTIEQIRQLGAFARAVLSRDSASVDESGSSTERER